MSKDRSDIPNVERRVSDSKTRQSAIAGRSLPSWSARVGSGTVAKSAKHCTSEGFAHRAVKLNGLCNRASPEHQCKRGKNAKADQPASNRQIDGEIRDPLIKIVHEHRIRELKTENRRSRFKPGQATHGLDPFVACFDDSIPMTAVGNDK